jgi:hypothetical protein
MGLDGSLGEALEGAVGRAVTVGAAQDTWLVVVSDGREILSQRAAVALTQLAGSGAARFAAVGVGPGASYDPNLLTAMAAMTKGEYFYVSSSADAAATFGAGFDSAFGVAAEGVSLQVTLPPFFEVEEEPDTVLVDDADVLRRQSLAPGRTALFRQLVSVCDPLILATGYASIYGVVRFDEAHYVAGEPTYEMPVTVATPLAVPALGTDTVPARRARAVIAYADALRGPVPARLEQTSALLADLGDDAVISAVADKLLHHPLHPSLSPECQEP